MGKWGNGGVPVPRAAVCPGGSGWAEPSTVLVSPHSVPPPAPGTVWSSVRGAWGLQARVVAVPGWLLAPRYTVRCHPAPRGCGRLEAAFSQVPPALPCVPGHLVLLPAGAAGHGGSGTGLGALGRRRTLPSCGCNQSCAVPQSSAVSSGFVLGTARGTRLSTAPGRGAGALLTLPLLPHWGACLVIRHKAKQRRGSQQSQCSDHGHHFSSGNESRGWCCSHQLPPDARSGCLAGPAPQAPRCRPHSASPAPRVAACSLPKHTHRIQPRQDAQGTAWEGRGAAAPARCLPSHPGQLQGNCSDRAQACGGSDPETSWACNNEPPAAGSDGFGSLGLGTLTGSAMEQLQRPRNATGPGCTRGCLQSDVGCVLTVIRKHRAQEASRAVQIATSLREAR